MRSCETMTEFHHTDMAGHVLSRLFILLRSSQYEPYQGMCLCSVSLAVYYDTHTVWRVSTAWLLTHLPNASYKHMLLVYFN